MNSLEINQLNKKGLYDWITSIEKSDESEWEAVTKAAIKQLKIISKEIKSYDKQNKYQYSDMEDNYDLLLSNDSDEVIGKDIGIPDVNEFEEKINAIKDVFKLRKQNIYTKESYNIKNEIEKVSDLYEKVSSSIGYEVIPDPLPKW